MNQDIDLLLFNSNDPKEFEKVYHLLFDKVYYFARRFLEQPDSEDITSIAFSKLWSVRDKHFENLQKIKIFLQVCVRNEAMNIFRSKKYADRYGRFVYLQDEPDDSQNEFIAEMTERVHAAINDLSPQRRKIIMMFYFEQKRVKQIAKELHLSESSVGNQLCTAIKKLRLLRRANESNADVLPPLRFSRPADHHWSLLSIF